LAFEIHVFWAVLRAVLFDLDDTLYDREAALRRFVSDQHRRLGLDCEEGAFVESFIALDRRGKVWKDEVYHDLKEQFEIPLSAEELLAEYVDLFRDHVIPHAGLRSALENLKADGLRLGLITNGRSGFQQRTLGGLGLDDLFDAVIVSGEVGCRKPEAAIFHLTLGRLGVRADEVAMIGDDLKADIEGAQGVGIFAMHVEPQGGWVEELFGAPFSFRPLRVAPDLDCGQG
jgi:putative hydrolase of the HAD superfamily